MNFADKMQNRAEELKGVVKEKVGDAADDERLQAEGAREQATARARQAAEHGGEAGRDPRDAFDH